MEADAIASMQALETAYRSETGLRDRSQYKIFCCQIRPAQMLLLQNFPAGKPNDLLPNGITSISGRPAASASAAYFENNEHDLIDCTWAWTRIRKLLVPLFGNTEAVRNNVVATNMAFRRKLTTASRYEDAMNEAKPYLTKIIDVVKPQVIILAGAKLNDFVKRYCASSEPIGGPIIHPWLRNLTVFSPHRVVLNGTTVPVLGIQVSPPQFVWTYAHYDLSSKILDLMKLGEGLSSRYARGGTIRR